LERFIVCFVNIQYNCISANKVWHADGPKRKKKCTEQS
jgi:hypothetical protein